jgi:hypothetical protein
MVSIYVISESNYESAWSWANVFLLIKLVAFEWLFFNLTGSEAVLNNKGNHSPSTGQGSADGCPVWEALVLELVLCVNQRR